MKKSSIPAACHKMAFLLKTLLQKPYLTREEINSRWLDDPHSDDDPFERKALYRFRGYIEELFHITIKWKEDENQNRQYYIENPEDLGSTKLYEWTLSALRMSDILLHAQPLHNRIVMEEFPSENGRMLPILEAMSRSVYLSISYRRYGMEEIRNHVIAPYCIKQYKQRLYLVGAKESGMILSFSLDRILDLSLLDEKFHLPAGFDAELYFLNAFGIVADDDKYPPQRVVLRASSNEACYLKDVPIHQSQDVINATADYTDFAYTISITDELIGHILSRADRLRVLSPDSLAEEVKHRHLMSAALYDESLS